MTHIQQRRDQAAVWTATNPVLYDGESGHESDTGREKMGDGLTTWNALPYKYGVDSVAGKTGEVELDVADVDGAAPSASPTFTGSPTAPTPDTSDNDNSIATTAFVKAALTAFLATVWPVNSIYVSHTPTNPATIFGGTWVNLGAGRMMIGVQSGEAWDAHGNVGGQKEVTLTSAQSGVKAHSHGVNDAGHTHTEDGTLATAFLAASGGSYGITIPDPTTTGSSVTGITIQNAAAAPASDPHTNMPPWVAVYQWRRTA